MINDSENEQLSPKQEKFANYFVETGNATASYKRAYSTGKMTDNTAGAAACRLLRNHKGIQNRIRQLRDENAVLAIRSVAEIKALLSTIAFSEDIAVRTRIQAARLLLQSQGALRSETSHEINVVSEAENVQIVLPKIQDAKFYEVDYDGPEPPTEYEVIE